MPSRAVVTNYTTDERATQFDPSGNFLLCVNVLYTDTSDLTKKLYNQPVIVLPSDTPSSWPGLIRQTIVANGIAAGFSDLVTTAVEVLFWPQIYTEQFGTQASLSNIIAAQTLISFTPFESGLLNVLSRRITIRGTIAYSTGALETPAVDIIFGLEDGTDVLNIIDIGSLAVSGGNNDAPIRFSFNAVVAQIGSPAALIGTGDLLVTSMGVTTSRNMLPEWLSADPIDLTGTITAKLKIGANTNLSSAHLVEAFLKIE